VAGAGWMKLFLVSVFICLSTTSSWANSAATCIEHKVAIEMDLAMSGLNKQETKLIRTHAKSVMTIDEFLRDRALGKGKILLGPGDRQSPIYGAIQRYKDMTTWAQGWNSVGEVPAAGGARLAEAMEKMTAKESDIFFLVPENFRMTTYFTKEEMVWLLAHPERMRNVHFIFGSSRMLNLNSNWEQNLRIIRNGFGNR
jgi:hypothetical protein